MNAHVGQLYVSQVSGMKYMYALLLCKSDTLYDIRQIYMKQISDICFQIFVLSDIDKLY